MIFDRYSLGVVDRMTGPHAFYDAAVDEKKTTVELSQYRGGNQKLHFSFTRPTADLLTLDGTLDGLKTHIELSRDPGNFLLQTRGFHWRSEFPFNR